MLDTYTSYQLIARDLPKSLERVEAQPATRRETAYYLDKIETVKSIEEFLADDRLFKYAMKAHGLKDMDYAKAFMKKALTEGIDESDSFANKLTDKRYAEFVETYNFARHGENATIFTRARQGTVDMFLRQTLEENAGAQNEGVRLALYFERKAPELTNYYEILADPALGKVVRSALSLPESFASADVDKQAKYFEEKFKLEDFQDPEKLGKFLQRFTSLWELANPTATPQTSLSALFSQPAEFGISASTLMALQTLRR